jgi:peptidoglycan/LPS O-acetylase OafA/YrhL
MQNLTSRRIPALDGLRGVAILAVLVHHQLTPLALRGGFLGVDLFFVLSGFLITGLLLAEFQQAGEISLRKFYLRRVLRLGPALFLYLAGCLLVTWYYQPNEFTRELKLIGIGLAYATNWRMAFGWDTSLDPTAIIWSLSIEEQFYLIWPLVLSACLALKLKRRAIVCGLILVIGSIIVNRYALLRGGADLTRLYYGTDTHADALLVGCIAAFVPVVRLRASGLTLLGLLVATLLGYSIAALDFTSLFLYRGGFTLVSVLVGILILVVANAPRSLPALILQWRLLRWFGQISYGLYLWHWLVIRNISFYYLGWWEPWVKLALALGIASASFYLVEKPFNRMKARYEVKRSATPIPAEKTLAPGPDVPVLSVLKGEEKTTTATPMPAQAAAVR